MFNKKRKFILFFIMFFIILTACSTNDQRLSNNESLENLDEIIEVHFIDVGQGDSIYIKQGDSHMLIDGGDVAYRDRVVDYLESKGVHKLDYVIGTHPHADHIGGLDKVIKDFEIGKIILPEVSHTTKAFERMLLAIEDKNLKISLPKLGDIHNLGKSKFTIIAPNSTSYNNLNNYSVGIKLDFANNSFLLTGDAEVESENEMVNNSLDLQADLLKLGHHGSDTSTSEDFLEAVDPSYAVISLGKDNKYGHPDDSVLKRLEEKQIKVYRSDLQGTIVARGDGEKINIQTQNSPKSSNKKKPLNQNFIGNKNSKIFHRSTCSSLPKEENRIYFDKKETAINQAYEGCKICKP